MCSTRTLFWYLAWVLVLFFYHVIRYHVLRCYCSYTKYVSCSPPVAVVHTGGPDCYTIIARGMTYFWWLVECIDCQTGLSEFVVYLKG